MKVYNVTLSLLLPITILRPTTQEVPINANEGKMLIDLMKHLQIKRSIIVGNKNFSTVNLSSFKNIFTSETFSAVQTENETFLPYFSNVTVEPKTMLVYKPVENVDTIKEYFFSLHKKLDLRSVCRLTWIMFITESEFKNLNLSVPHDCEFYTVHDLHSKRFKVTKIYSIGQNLHFQDYGTWSDSHDYVFSQLPRFNASLNANKTKFTGAYTLCSLYQIGYYMDRNQVYDDCIKETFVVDVMVFFNFKLVGWWEYQNETLWCDFRIEFIKLYGGNHPHKSFVKCWPKHKFELIIKYPETENRADFYLEPFDFNLWMALISTLIFGALFCPLIKYFESLGFNSGREFNVIDYFMIPYDAICSQGEELDTNRTFRLCCFIFNFLAIFIFQSYCADLAAYLASQKLELPFRNLEELVENGKYKILIEEIEGYRHSFIPFSYFEDRNDSVGQRVIDSLIEYQFHGFMFQNVCIGEKYAVAYTVDLPLRFIDCRLFRVPQAMTLIFPATELGPRNYFASMINHKFLQLRECGAITKVMNDVEYYKIGSYLRGEEEPLKPVDINQLVQIFLILGSGIIIGSILFIGEIFVGKLKKRSTPKRKKYMIES